jgi:hypothetical protein
VEAAVPADGGANAVPLLVHGVAHREAAIAEPKVRTRRTA